MNNNNIEREFDWNDTIENDSTFEILPDGDYDFTITKFTRGRYEGGAKISACPKAIVEFTLNVNGEEKRLEENFLLHSKCEGILCNFFTGIGLRQRGEKLQMRWDQIVGQTGRCKVGTRTWKNKYNEDIKSNEIKKYYEPTPKTGFKAGEF